MGRTATLLGYKIRFFFAPSFRGRFGPLVYLALVLIFVPSGWAIGFGLGTTIQAASPEAALSAFSVPLAAMLSLGLLYSLGSGVTAHPSELHFFMTAPLRPREFLVADLAFQFVTILGAGGAAVGVAALAIVATMGRPLALAAPLLGILVAYAAFVLMASQILVVLRVRYPRAPVRTATVGLLALSVLPTLSGLSPGFPIRFTGVPVPSTAFAELGLALLTGGGFPALSTAAAAATVALVGVAWLFASRTYVFHGIRPTLSAGFGQIDLSARIDTQSRMIGGLGRVTTLVRFRPERGGETGLMTRLHLLRMWRDGSFLFIGLFAVIAIAPALLAGGQPGTSATLGVTQILLFLLAILAINWAYYERVNLWLVATAAGPTGAYFRGLLLSLAAIGLGTSVLFLTALVVAQAARLPIEAVALPVAAPFGAAIAATALVMRTKLKPAAFSPAVLGIFFVVEIAGFLGGLVAEGLVRAGGLVAGLGDAFRAGILLVYVVGIAGLGLWGVTRLAASVSP